MWVIDNAPVVTVAARHLDTPVNRPAAPCGAPWTYSDGKKKKKVGPVLISDVLVLFFSFFKGRHGTF